MSQLSDSYLSFHRSGQGYHIGGWGEEEGGTVQQNCPWSMLLFILAPLA